MTATVVQELFTPEQVALLLKVKRATIYGWLRSKSLKSRKAGKLYRITPANIEDFLKK